MAKKKAKNEFKEYCWFESVDDKVSHHWVQAKSYEEAAEKFFACGFNGGIIKEGMEGFDPYEEKDKAELYPDLAKEVEEHNAKLGMEQVTVTGPMVVDDKCECACQFGNGECKCHCHEEAENMQDDIIREAIEYVKENANGKIDAIQKFSQIIREKIGIYLVGGYIPYGYKIHKRHPKAKNWNRMVRRPYARKGFDAVAKVY